MSDLPPPPPAPVSFDRPPVAEVALAAQFADPVTDEATTLGRFWPKIQERFPVVETQHAMPPMSEDFRAASQPKVMFEMLSAPPAPRFWLQTEDRSGLVQIQPDRLVYNWRKDPGGFDYPRYNRLRSTFADVYRVFDETCVEQGRVLRPTWCEVTYINPIEVPPSDEGTDLGVVLRRLQPLDLLGLGVPEDSNLNERYILHRDGEPYGRFYITAVPGVRIADGARLVMLTLTVRGLVRAHDIAGVVEFFDEGRDLIVNGFKELTTAEMHNLWGLQA